MLDFIDFFRIREVQPKDIIDVFIVWFIIYQLLKFLSGTRTKQMAFGLMSLFVAQILAEQFQLNVISKTIGSLFNIIPIAIIVLFQREIRRVLASIGSNPFSNKSTRSSVLDSVFEASLALSQKEIGALIVFEGEQGLRDYIEAGHRLDAMPSKELLIDIFQPKSILHDGAVIISDSRIASAACLLPLSRNPHLPKHYGTRHRAAVGISEETDCVALVVSEETGRISFGYEGVIYPVREHHITKLYETYNSLLLPEGREKIEILRSFRDQLSFNVRRSRNGQGKRRSAAQTAAVKEREKAPQEEPEKQEAEKNQEVMS